MSDDVKLLGCPFCSEANNLQVEAFDCEDREGTPTRVSCDGCGCQGPWEYERDGSSKCVAAWNRRAPAPLAWSSERPKVVGRYYHRWMTSEGWKVSRDLLRVTESDLRNPKTWWIEHHQVAGPIPEPQEQP